MSTEHEYDTEQTMLDQPDHERANTSNPRPDQLHGSYPPQFGDPQQRPQENGYYQQQMSMQPEQHQAMPAQGQYEQSSMMHTTQPQATGGMTGSFDAMGQVIDPNDPMLDADPFGLSASMHYPTSYSVMEQQASQR